MSSLKVMFVRGWREGGSYDRATDFPEVVKFNQPDAASSADRPARGQGQQPSAALVYRTFLATSQNTSRVGFGRTEPSGDIPLCVGRRSVIRPRSSM